MKKIILYDGDDIIMTNDKDRGNVKSPDVLVIKRLASVPSHEMINRFHPLKY